MTRQVEAHPFCFDDPNKLVAFLRGARVLYNTYWVRFNHTSFAHETAVHNTKILFDAAQRAGVQRVVHVSITHPSLESKLEYFAGKAELEQCLVESGLSHAVLRPTVLFGKEDILINKIAWLLRRFPVFGLFGDGQYRLQPIYVDDLAVSPRPSRLFSLGNLRMMIRWTRRRQRPRQTAHVASDRYGDTTSVR